MGIIGWIVLGLLAGAIAKAIMPGTQRWRLVGHSAPGCRGRAARWVHGSAIFGIGLDTFWSFQTWIVAILGSLLVLAIWGFVTKNHRA